MSLSPCPPSRDANPFATCWTRPGALPYLETDRARPDDVVTRLAAAGWRGQLVGEHGSGKSALLQELSRLLNARGVVTVGCKATRGEHSLESPSGPEAPVGKVLMVEGFERLTRRERSRLLKHWRELGLGFVVTTHRPLVDWWRPLPVLAALRPDERLLRRLFDGLTADRATPVAWADARRAFARRRGRLREVWFDLYDLHERHTRGERTVAVVVSYTEARRIG
ncbi:hypothetical protein MalM25_20870 [Planctomycetes bacterium MalM25]|nr:hypothetical protein MalM25_20870 [Planctomycetes bacterium MalM25]